MLKTLTKSTKKIFEHKEFQQINLQILKVQPNQQNKLLTLRYLTKLIFKYLKYQQKSSNVKNINKKNL